MFLSICGSHWKVSMPTLDLSPAEISVLRDVLEGALSDLGTEIAGTDSHDYREGLKERREVLRRIAAAVEQVTRIG